jgi:hypothetical protein
MDASGFGGPPPGCMIVLAIVLVLVVLALGAAVGIGIEHLLHHVSWKH